MNNLLITISFVGTNYCGSQIQINGKTIQGEVQKALSPILNEQPNIKCCSRTDSGVHANCFCISFFTNSNINPNRLIKALNTKLPPDIRVLNAIYVPEDFHARYNCIKKQYVYKVCNSPIMSPFLYGRAHRFYLPINEAEIHKTAQVFVGTHDFKAMSGSKCESESTVRTVYDFSVEREGEIVSFVVSADGFLYNMVRIMVGTLLCSARGKIDADEIKSIIEQKTRTNYCITAPAEGLYLDKVIYKLTE